MNNQIQKLTAIRNKDVRIICLKPQQITYYSNNGSSHPLETELGIDNIQSCHLASFVKDETKLRFKTSLKNIEILERSPQALIILKDDIDMFKFWVNLDSLQVEII